MPDEGPPPPKQIRYQRVKQILNEASAGSCPSYQGYGKFWELPLAEFLEVTIYGVRMIAPESTAPPGECAPTPPPAGGSCCHGVSSEEPTVLSSVGSPRSEAAHTPSPVSGRGAASGLIIGLKGQCPFDGTQFPRLPWGGTPLSVSNIEFIQHWIDDGCPAEDKAAVHVEVSHNIAVARAKGDEVHPLFTGVPNTLRDDAGSIKIRKNVDFLSPEELRRFRCAIAKMKSYDSFFQDERSFGYWARIHGNLCQHGWEEFLTWHRLYLYFFEQQIQDIDPAVTLPYWDWTADGDDENVKASIFDMSQARVSAVTDNGIVPEAYRCFLTEEAIQQLKAGGQVPIATLAKLEGFVGKQYNSGLRLFAAAGVSYGADKTSDNAILEALAKVNPLWHRFRWPGGNHDLIFQSFPTQADVNRILQLPQFFSFGSGPADDHFFGALENIHNLIHNFSGGGNPNFVPGTQPENRIEPQSGDMVFAGMTAYDPIFWGHHSNVDRLWAEWQKLHPGAGPDNPTSPLPPWNMVVDQTDNIQSLGYEYMKSAYVYPTSADIPIAKFRSASANVHPEVLSDHRRAEVRLHRVRYTARAGFHIRVFLNSPNADASTPVRGNDRFVGQLNTFTGFCVGGPGHCETPKEGRRKFDHRSRHHKTPGNFRVDATETVRKLVAAGESDLHVTLVVLNTDGTPATDALRLDAVSLNFLD
jgi:tyrosinase